MTAPSLEQAAVVPVSTGTNLSNVKRSLFTSAASAAVGLPLALVVLPLLLGHLSKAEYGAYATVSSFLAIALLAESGIAAGITKQVADAKGRDRPDLYDGIVSRGTSLLWLLGVIVIAAGVLAAVLLPHLVLDGTSASVRRDYPYVVVAIAVILAANIVAGGFFAVLSGLQRSDFQRWGDISGSLASAATLIIAVENGCGLWSFVLSSLALLIFSGAVQTYGVTKVAPTVGFRLVRPDFAASREFATLSSVLFLAAISAIIDFQFDKLVLAHFLGAAAAGTYQIGSTLALQAKTLAVLPSGLMLAGVAELLRQPDTLATLERGINRVTLLATGVVLGGVIVFAPIFVSVWLGPGYSQAAFAAQLVAVSLVPGCLAAAWPSIAIGHGWMAPLVASAVVNIVVNGTVSFVLVATIGFNGSLYGSLAGNLSASLVGWVLLVRCEKRAWWRPILPGTLALTALTVAGLLLARQLSHSWAALLAGGVAWTAVCCLALGVLGQLPVALSREGGRLRLEILR